MPCARNSVGDRLLHGCQRFGKAVRARTGVVASQAILDSAPVKRIYFLNVGAGEIVSILVRKRNAGLLSVSEFGQAMASFDAEILHAADIARVSVTSRLVTAFFQLIVAHSINSSDAIALKSALMIARRLRAAGDDLVLVASDQRLLRAAQAEGLATFNPEIQDPSALAALLGP